MIRISPKKGVLAALRVAGNEGFHKRLRAAVSSIRARNRAALAGWPNSAEPRYPGRGTMGSGHRKPAKDYGIRDHAAQFKYASREAPDEKAPSRELLVLQAARRAGRERAEARREARRERARASCGNVYRPFRSSLKPKRARIWGGMAA